MNDNLITVLSIHSEASSGARWRSRKAIRDGDGLRRLGIQLTHPSTPFMSSRHDSLAAFQCFEYFE